LTDIHVGQTRTLCLNIFVKGLNYYSTSHKTSRPAKRWFNNNNNDYNINNNNIIIIDYEYIRQGVICLNLIIWYYCISASKSLLRRTRGWLFRHDDDDNNDCRGWITYIYVFKPPRKLKLQNSEASSDCYYTPTTTSPNCLFDELSCSRRNKTLCQTFVTLSIFQQISRTASGASGCSLEDF